MGFVISFLNKVEINLNLWNLHRQQDVNILVLARKRNNNPRNIWDWKFLSMLPVEEGQDKGILRSEATGNQESDRRVMMQSLRRWWGVEVEGII